MSDSYTPQWRRVRRIPELLVNRAGDVLMSADGSRATVTRDKQGYKSVTIPRLRWPVRVHIMVASTWIRAIPRGHEVHHKDGNRDNNHVTNLTILSHTKHEKAHGRKFDQLNHPAQKVKRQRKSKQRRYTVKG